MNDDEDKSAGHGAPPSASKGDGKPPPGKPSASEELFAPAMCFARVYGELTGNARLFAMTAHRTARTVHGWKEHRHHGGGAFKMTLSDYRAAIAAANPERGPVVPHAAALSQYRGKGI